MKRRLVTVVASIMLAVGGLGLAACHTTDPGTLCRDYVNNLNAAAGFNRWSLVSATQVGADARCLLRNNQTFAQVVRCIDSADHEPYIC